MVAFNLLPWREYERAYQAKVTIILLALTSSACAIILLITHVMIKQKIEDLQTNIVAIRAEIMQQARLNFAANVSGNQGANYFTEQINSYRHADWQLLDLLQSASGQGSCLTQLRKKADAISLQGYARSWQDVTVMLDKYEKSPWLQRIGVKNIQQQMSEHNHYFVLMGEQQHSALWDKENDVAKDISAE